MKTLIESLFDADLTTQELSVEKMVRELNKSSLKDMSPEHIMDIINSIMNCGEIHSTADVKSYKTDLSKNVLMCVRKYLKIYSKKK